MAERQPRSQTTTPELWTLRQTSSHVEPSAVGFASEQPSSRSFAHAVSQVAPGTEASGVPGSGGFGGTGAHEHAPTIAPATVVSTTAKTNEVAMSNSVGLFLGMALNLIGTYAGIPFYADEELTDEDVQERFLLAIESEKASLEATGVTAAKTILKAGRVYAVTEDPADDPRLP